MTRIGRPARMPLRQRDLACLWRTISGLEKISVFVRYWHLTTAPPDRCLRDDQVMI